MRAKSIKGSSPEEIKTALLKSMADGYRPTLAIVFISIKQNREAVCEVLHNNSIDIIGATSSGEFVDGYQSQGETAILLFDLSREDYFILFESTKDRDINSAVEKAAKSILSKFHNPGLILLSTCLSDSGEMFDGRTLIHCLEKALGEDVDVFGGMAGADGALAGTNVFNNKHFTDEGFALLVLNTDKIDLTGSAISGWKPIGKVRTVTNYEDGWIYELDGQPALEMYLRYLGQKLNNEDESGQIFFVEDIGFFYPFIAINSGEPILRTPMEVSKEKNAIKLDFPLHEGEQLQFTLPPDFDIIENVLDNAAELKAKQNYDADALLVFSCLGRISALGPLITEENEGLNKIWNAPMAGFFTYGEYGKSIDNNYKFHSTTCSWVAIKEK
jgi:hypothetical protein